MNIGDSVGSYRIVGTVGEGGMGSVYLAEHNLIGRYAAIKVLHAHLSDREEQVERFFNEARATSSIKHPGILEVFDFGWADDGSAYIVMEYLEGESLEHRIQRLGQLSTEHALHITRQIAGALGAAHLQGVIHRDLKPENIFIVRDPEVAGGERIKILDFGIAKLMHDPSKTRVGALIGTPDYMAPEQCRGAGHVDQRADFYALGCMLFRMLCGRPPFVGEGVGEVLSAHMHVPAPAPSAIDPRIEPLLEGFVMRLLSKGADERPGSAAELITELDAVWVGTFPGAMAVGTSAGVDRGPMGKSAVRQSHGGPSTISSAAMEIASLPEHRSGRGSLRVVAISTAMVLAVGGAGFAMFGFGALGGDDQQTAQGPTTREVDTGDLPVARAGKRGRTSAPQQITVTLESEPDGADVFRASDGLRVGKTPYRYSLDPVQGELVYIVKMDGYKPQDVSFDANKDGSQTIELEKIGGRSRADRDRSNKTKSVDPFEEIETNDPAAKEAEALLRNLRETSKKEVKKPTRKPAKKPTKKPTKKPSKKPVNVDKVFDPFQ
ncbi:MAG: serine/threonine protein kinase [Deltaproteobacteria bacterium]|nr:serine/threonine protein kinase [Deltaproteobacteria bacterium]